MDHEDWTDVEDELGDTDEDVWTEDELLKIIKDLDYDDVQAYLEGDGGTP